MNWRIGMILLVGLILGADSPEEVAFQKEKTALAGTWKVITIQVGKKRESGLGLEIEIPENKIGMIVAEKKEGEVKEFCIEPQKSPKWLDWNVPAAKAIPGVPGSVDTEAHTIRSLYRVTGDTLVICHKDESKKKDAAKERPENLEPKGDIVLMTLKRVKAKK